ncbi:MAG TPA: hypothetical protein VJK29_17010, partial [Terriglobales bacterium]|nr:hypothetical protein [Terriglobales bacterium]
DVTSETFSVVIEFSPILPSKIHSGAQAVARLLPPLFFSAQLAVDGLFGAPDEVAPNWDPLIAHWYPAQFLDLPADVSSHG